MFNVLEHKNTNKALLVHVNEGDKNLQRVIPNISFHYAYISSRN